MILKPCPFCGNNIGIGVFDENEMDIRDEDDCVKTPYYSVCCSVNKFDIEVPNWKPGCGSSSGFYETKEEAIIAWNNRVRKW